MRPVAAQHALEPRADRRDLGGVERRHARRPGAVVEHHGLGDDRRVLGAVEVHRVPVRVLREVVPAVAGSGERDLPRRHGPGQRAREPAELRAAVIAQQALVAGHVGGRRVDLDRPVDLVEPQRRVEVEGVVGRCAHVLLDVRGLGRRQADLLAGHVGHGQPADHGRVDHRVLPAGRPHRRAPAPVVRLVARRAGALARGARGRGGQGRRARTHGYAARRIVEQPDGQRAGAGVVAAGPAVAGAGGRRVQVQEIGVERRLTASWHGVVPARRRSSSGRASARPGPRRPSSRRRGSPRYVAAGPAASAAVRGHSAKAPGSVSARPAPAAVRTNRRRVSPGASMRPSCRHADPRPSWKSAAPPP